MRTAAIGATIGGLGALVAAVSIGCSNPAEPKSPPPAQPPEAAPSAPAPAAPALPAPEALTEVIYRLADPAIPGTDKTQWVADTADADADAVAGFATALRDGGFSPVRVTATDLNWSQSRPGDVSATITLTPPLPAGGAPPREFRFPMEFRPGDTGWQLTRETAEMLLTIGP